MKSFKCGVWDIDRFLAKNALPNDQNDLGRTFVVVSEGTLDVIGFYTMSNGSVRADALAGPPLPANYRFPLGTVHIGKLAVSRAFQRQGLGEHLLVDAICRTVRISQQTAIYAIDLIAADPAVIDFYSEFGFRAIPDTPNHLFLPIQKARAIARAAGQG